MSLTRRQFIRIGGATAGAAAVASGLTTRWWGQDRDRVDDPGTDGERVVPTTCELCFWGCGVKAHVKDGRVTKLVGNPDHPLSRGMLCPRGAGGTGLLYDPDRLTQPLVRRRNRGEDVFEAVSWDAALNEVGEKLLAVKARHGPEALALFTHGSGGVWFKQLMKAWGSPNVGAPSYAQCRGPREAGFLLTYGTPLGSPEPIDLANARVITLIGSHLGENMHNTQVQELAEAVGKGAELVVVDPLSNLVHAGTPLDARSLVTRLIDYLKGRGITALFTSLTPGGDELERSELGVSSLVDTWLLLEIVRSAGERNRLLSIIKSRGMPHSNQAVEFRLTGAGLEFLDTYLGRGVVLSGAARLTQEAEDRAAAATLDREVLRRESVRDARRLAYQARATALRGEFAAQDAEQAMAVDEIRGQRDRVIGARAEMARSRQAFIPARVPAGRRNGRRKEEPA
jgi:hypothetical protein